MANKTYNILVLCTGNSARSIMAEALFNVLGKGRFKAYSAGSHPTGTVNPLVMEAIAWLDYPVNNLRSKSWNEFATPGAPKMDFIFTVCDKAAGETCPVWPGQPITAHWGFEDPAAFLGSNEEKLRKIQHMTIWMSNRIQMFANLSLENLDKLAIKREMDHIGQIKEQ